MVYMILSGGGVNGLANMLCYESFGRAVGRPKKHAKPETVSPPLCAPLSVASRRRLIALAHAVCRAGKAVINCVRSRITRARVRTECGAASSAAPQMHVADMSAHSHTHMCTTRGHIQSQIGVCVWCALCGVLL